MTRGGVVRAGQGLEDEAERVGIAEGRGLEGDSSSQRMLRTYQRWPSLRSWMVLMPRVKGFSAAVWRDS